MGIYGNDLFRISLVENIPDMTLEEIASIYEMFDYQSLNESVVLNEASAGKLFSTLGLSTSKIMSAIQKCAKSCAASIKDCKGINKDSKAKMSKHIDICKDDIVKEFSNMDLSQVFEKIPANKQTVPANIIKSIFLFLQVFVTNTLVSTILNTLGSLLGGIIGSFATPGGAMVGITVGNISARVITGVLVAPVIEENAKNISERGKFAVEYDIIFNMFEFALYVSQGVSPLLRLLPVAMHTFNHMIHHLGQSEKVIKMFKLDPKNEEDKKKMNKIAHFTAIMVHFIWNSVSFAASKDDFKKIIDQTKSLSNYMK